MRRPLILAASLLRRGTILLLPMVAIQDSRDPLPATSSTSGAATSRLPCADLPLQVRTLKAILPLRRRRHIITSKGRLRRLVPPRRRLLLGLSIKVLPRLPEPLFPKQQHCLRQPTTRRTLCAEAALLAYHKTIRWPLVLLG